MTVITNHLYRNTESVPQTSQSPNPVKIAITVLSGLLNPQGLSDDSDALKVCKFD